MAFQAVPAIVLFLQVLSASCDDFPFNNVKLPWNERVDDLVARLSQDELVDQLSKGGTSPLGGPAPAIPRLGIKPYSWNTECLRGLVQAGPATSYPQALGLAATFNRTVLFAVAEATSKEARAKYYNYTQHEEYGDHKGLSCFSPVINIMRHPLWGRNQETYGEDPYLSGEMAVEFVKGLQGNDSRYIRTNAGCKHFDAHGGPENIPESRFSFNAMVTERDMRLTFLPAFRSCVVKGGSLSIMCSYNRINGVPACANGALLTDILREEWGFTGYVVSDQDALENIVDKHKWKKSYEEAAAAALKAGTNLGLSTTNPKSVFTYLPLAIEKKLVTLDDLREAAKPLFYVRMRLGEFDPPEMNPFSKYSLDLIQSAEHKELSLASAMQSFVLLENKNNFLPLVKNKYKTITVVGPMADNGPELYGDYAPTYDPKETITPLQTFKEIADLIYYTDGCSEKNPLCTKYDSDDVKRAVEGETDLIVVCLGNGDVDENEGGDRHSLELPGYQKQLLQDVIKYKNAKVPVVLLLFNAGPVFLDNDPGVDAILECFYPAQFAGEAIKRVLFNEGPNSNPAGRLPFTWHDSDEQVPNMTDYSMAGRTYRYWTVPTSPRFPFGYGLSYSKFKYSALTVPKTIGVFDNLTLSISVTNTGPYDGDEVVQVYISWLNPLEKMPQLQLVGFDRIHLKNGESVGWSHTIDVSQLAVYTEESGFVNYPGQIRLYVGGQQPNQTVNVGSNVLSEIIVTVL